MLIKRMVGFATLALVGALVAGCGGDATSADSGSSGSGDAGGSPGEDAGTALNDAAAGMDGGPQATAHFACPLFNGKPQKAYGQVVPSLGAILDHDETWTPDNVYLIFGPFSTGAHTLTIQAGTVVCLDFDQIKVLMPPPGSLTVETGGALMIQGTASNHVTFTSKNSGETDAYWGGINFGFNFLGTSSLQNLDLYDGGSGSVIQTLSEGAAGMNPGPALDLQNVNVYYALNKGLAIGGAAGVTATSTVTVHSYAPQTTDPKYINPAFTIHPLFAKSLLPNMFKIDLGVPDRAKVIQLGESMFPLSVHLLDVGIPYRADGGGIMLAGTGNAADPGAVPAVLTIDPGVTLASFDMIYVGYHSNGAADLVAVGTADKPITFTSANLDPTVGWSGLLFEADETNPATTRIDHAVIEQAGAPGKETIYNCWDNSGNYLGGEVNVDWSTTSANYAGPTITNTIFRKPMPKTDAVRARCTTATGACDTVDYTAAASGNTFEGFPMTCAASDSTMACTQRPLGCPM